MVLCFFTVWGRGLLRSDQVGWRPLTTPVRHLASKAYGATVTADVAIVGLGAYGMSALYHMAREGMKVVGLERYHPAHPHGSSHGQSRIIRLAYMEGPAYVPLLRRSLNLWLQLEDKAGEKGIYTRTGMLDLGAAAAPSLASAQLHGLQYEVMHGAEVNARYPGYNLPGDMPAVLQADGGILAPERILKTYARLAEAHGALIMAGQHVTSWAVPNSMSTSTSGVHQGSGSGSGGVVVRTASGTEVHAGQLLLAAGPWMAELVPQLATLCVPERQVVGWFPVIQAGAFQIPHFPVFLIDDGPKHMYYGFPQFGPTPGFKIGKYHHLREAVPQPDSVDRCVSAADSAALLTGVDRYFKGVGRQPGSAGVCFFTNTPDGHFLVDRHPKHPQVMLCSACSGHGFKMSSGIGQLLAKEAVKWPAGDEEANAELGMHRFSDSRQAHEYVMSKLAR